MDDSFVVVSLKKLGNNLRFVSSFTPEEVDEAYLAWADKILAEEITIEDYAAIFNSSVSRNRQTEEFLCQIKTNSTPFIFAFRQGHSP